jgi:uncharacterized protein (PEP-CTERM system associated)
LVAKADEGRGAAWEIEQPSARYAGGMRTALVLVTLTLATAAPRVHAQVPGAAAPAETPGGGPAVPATENEPAAAGQPGQEPAGREWTITPGLSDTEEFTDNALFTPTNRQGDLITTFTPSIYLNGDTPRLQATLNYSPQIIEHAAVTSQNQVTQNLAANGTLTAVPQTLFLDVEASASNVSRAGGFGYGNQAQIPSSLSTQSFAYSGSPYAQFHFGDTGDAEVRYTVQEVTFTGNTGPVASPVAGTSLGSLSNSTQNEGSAKFTTGQAFGRTQLTALADYTDYLSSSSTSSQHSLGDVTAQYNIYGPYFATADLGYERLAYTQDSPADYTGPRWQLGGLFQPREDRSFSLSYGRTEGNLGFASSMNYALTPLTSISGSYQVQSTSDQQQLLQGLNGLTQLGPGVSVNPTTGAPVVSTAPNPISGPTIGPTGQLESLQNPNLALQNSVERVKTLLLSVNMQGGERNTYSVTFNHTEEVAVTAGAISQTTTGGIASWNRDMSPLTTGVVSVAYSTTTSTAAGVAPTSTVGVLTFTGGVTYAVSDTLSAAASYSMTRQTGGAGGNVLVDLALVTLSKHF